jgi:chemotaxis response regulator CheB
MHDLPSAAFPLRSYDVIVLDYMLGRGDGLEWLKALKRRDDCPKVLFLTGAGNEIIAVRAIKAGADDYQRKQELTREKLIASIRELTATPVERTVSPDLASRMEGQNLRVKVRIPGIKILHLIGEGGTARVYLASREDDDDRCGENPAPGRRGQPQGDGTVHGRVRDGRAHPEPPRRAHPRARQVREQRLSGDGILRGR